MGIKLRLLKGFMLALTGLFIMITLLSLLIPSSVFVSRGVVVNASSRIVFKEIANLHNWLHWQPVFKSDTSKIKFSITDTDGKSFCEWVSNGKKNKLMITALADNAVTASLQREGENDVINMISILPLADTGTVQVEWRAHTRLKWYPWEKFYGIFIEKFTGPGYEEALNSLKAYVEEH